MSTFNAPPLIKVIDANGNPIFSNDSSGVTKIAQQFSGNPWANASGLGDAQSGVTTGAVAPWFFNGTGWDRELTPSIWRTGVATAIGATTIWTPGAGNRIRLQAYKLIVSANAALAAAGILQISIVEAGVGNIWTHAEDIWLPAAAAGTKPSDQWASGWVLLPGNGYKGGAVNNAFQVNLSVALATGQLAIALAGVETA